MGWKVLSGTLFLLWVATLAGCLVLRNGEHALYEQRRQLQPSAEYIAKAGHQWMSAAKSKGFEIVSSDQSNADLPATSQALRTYVLRRAEWVNDEFFGAQRAVLVLTVTSANEVCVVVSRERGTM